GTSQFFWLAAPAPERATAHAQRVRRQRDVQRARSLASQDQSLADGGVRARVVAVLDDHRLRTRHGDDGTRVPREPLASVELEPFIDRDLSCRRRIARGRRRWYVIPAAGKGGDPGDVRRRQQRFDTRRDLRDGSRHYGESFRGRD